MKRLLCLLLLPVLLVPACGDDDPATPGDDPAFGVTVRVTDTAGDPVAGLDIALISDNDYLQDDFPPYKRGVAAVTKIAWQQPAVGRATAVGPSAAGAPARRLPRSLHGRASAATASRGLGPASPRGREDD